MHVYFLNMFGIQISLLCESSNGLRVLVHCKKPQLLLSGYHSLSCLFTFGPRAICMLLPKLLVCHCLLMRQHLTFDVPVKLGFVCRQIQIMTSLTESGLRERSLVATSKRLYMITNPNFVTDVDILGTQKINVSLEQDSAAFYCWAYPSSYNLS